MRQHIRLEKSPTNRAIANRIADRFDRTAELFGLRRVIGQALRDLFGTKDVQDAITVTYVWMADQIGHIALGGIFTLLACWLVTSFVTDGTWEIALCIVAAATIFGLGYWKERSDFLEVIARRGNIFRFNHSDISWNIRTALFYYALGIIHALTAFISVYLFIASFILWWPALRVGFWWLKRKMAFQQAGLPYLYRLANFKSVLVRGDQGAIGRIANMKDRPETILSSIFRHDRAAVENPPDSGLPRHLLVCGPLSSGKTSLAVGIGTEFAFTLGLGRYLSAIKLLELAAEEPQPDDMKTEDGRFLWPWMRCDLLIIDDVDVGLKANGNGVPGLIAPDDFAREMRTLLPGGAAPLHWLADRRSVWVVGNSNAAADWQREICGLLGVQAGSAEEREKFIMTIELGGPGAAQPQVQPKAPILRKVASYIGFFVGGLSLLLSVIWWSGEGKWGRFEALSPEEAFVGGSFGLELAPLKYFLVMSDVSKATMEPGDAKWPQRFGFIQRANATGVCVKDAPGNLPLGFSVTNRLPASATPVPVKFVGLTCATCHSTQVRDQVVLGAATQTADLIGFQDAVISAILDKNLTAEAIITAYNKKCPNDPATPVVTRFPIADRFIERLLISKWLTSTRDVFRRNAAKYDLAFDGREINNPENIPTGPSRSRPFRSVIRNALDFPGETNHAISKMPAVFMQMYKNWSQFDGSIKNYFARSLIAVFASGASIPALHERQIAHNVKAAAQFTQIVGTPDSPTKVPTLLETFPERSWPSDVSQGRSFYMTSCYGCHGGPGPERGTWIMPDDHKGPGPRIARLEEIRTDPARLIFRYADMLPTALTHLLPSRNVDAHKEAITKKAVEKHKAGAMGEADWWYRFLDASSVSSELPPAYVGDLAQRAREFPAGHRLAEVFRPGEIAIPETIGYQKAPIPYVWLRAPYLHNGSVPTLRALIGLEERPDKFCRGNAGYDPDAVGLRLVLPSADGTCPAEAPFLFDASVPGNSNQGHNYPESATPAQREALLAYLRTL